MNNVNIVLEPKGSKGSGGMLILRIDLTKTGTPSASGKSLIIASTLGNVEIPGTDGLKLGLNLYRPTK